MAHRVGNQPDPIHPAAQPGDVILGPGDYLDAAGSVIRVTGYDAAHARNVGHRGMHVWDTNEAYDPHRQPSGKYAGNKRDPIIARLNTWYPNPVPEAIRRLPVILRHMRGQGGYWLVECFATDNPRLTVTPDGVAHPPESAGLDSPPETSEPRPGETWYVRTPNTPEGQVARQEVIEITDQVVSLGFGNHYLRSAVTFVERATT